MIPAKRMMKTGRATTASTIATPRLEESRSILVGLTFRMVVSVSDERSKFEHLVQERPATLSFDDFVRCWYLRISYGASDKAEHAVTFRVERFELVFRGAKAHHSGFPIHVPHPCVPILQVAVVEKFGLRQVEASKLLEFFKRIRFFLLVPKGKS